MKFISEGLSQKADNFLLLRFIAAALVIYGHAPAITGGAGPEDLFTWLGWGEYSGSIAVDIFFIVSGFLVTGSFLRRRHVADFVWARFIRIIPAYAVCLLLWAFLFGPLFTADTFGEYFSGRAPIAYFWNNLRLDPSYLVWNLPEVFSKNPKIQTVNGSIWTLPAEVRMYVWAAFLGLIGVLSRRWAFNVLFAGLIILGALYPNHIPLVPLYQYVSLAGLFALGALCYVNRSWIPVHGGLLLGAVSIAYLCRSNWVYPYVFAICETQFVFWFAYNTKWWAFNRFGDFSYGIYLWGFPAQQMVAAVAGSLPTLANAVAGFVVALLIAVISWYAIEKPALRLKGAPSSLSSRLVRAFTS